MNDIYAILMVIMLIGTSSLLSLIYPRPVGKLISFFDRISSGTH